MNEANNTGYVTIDELAAHLKVKISTVRTWIKLGKLPADAYLKVSNTYRFNINEAIAGLKRTATAEAALPEVPRVSSSELKKVKEALVRAKTVRETTPPKEVPIEVRLGAQSFTVKTEDSDIDQLIGGTR